MRNLSPQVLKKLKVDALLVKNTVNIAYMTGVHCSSGTLLIEPKRKRLFVDSRYTEAAKLSHYPGVEVCSISEFMASIRALRRVGFEAASLHYHDYIQMKSRLKSIKLVQTLDLIEGLRRKKSSDEITAVLRAIRLTKSVLRSVPSLLRPGITERELAATIEYRCILAGAEAMAFPTIVAFGEHTSRPHHLPSSRRLRREDIVQIDCGVVLDSYCSDISRVYSVGQLKSEYRIALRALQEAKKTAESLLRPGVRVSSLDRAARAVLSRYGMEQAFTHSLGHGVGREVHELPSLSSRSKDRLRRGDVVTIEPGVYFPGRFGMRLEDTHIIV